MYNSPPVHNSAAHFPYINTLYFPSGCHVELIQIGEYPFFLKMNPLFPATVRSNDYCIYPSFQTVLDDFFCGTMNIILND